jgi:hypothetical protein
MKRSFQFEALEYRITMSASVNHSPVADRFHALTHSEGNQTAGSTLPETEVGTGMATGLAHPSVALAAKRQRVFKGSLTGGQSSLIPDTDYVAMGGFNGKLGKLGFQATLYGQVSGNSFEGGSLHLFNSQGDTISDLGPGTLKKSGKSEEVKVEFEFEQVTGPYTPLVGSAGTLTIELKHHKSTTKTAADGPVESTDWGADDALLDILFDSYSSAELPAILNLLYPPPTL